MAQSSPIWLRRYQQQYVQFDPSTTRHYFAEIGEGIATIDFMPYDEFLATRFYAEWARPQGFIDGLAMVLHKSGSKIAMLSVFRDGDDGRIDQEARRRMDIVAPHARRAALVTQAIGNATTRATTLADALDAVTAAVFLLNAGGRIVHVNAAGQAVLATGLMFHRSSDRLQPLDPEADGVLLSVLASLSRNESASLVRGAAVPLRAVNGALHVANALPLGPQTREGRLSASAVLALFVRPATVSSVAPPELLAKAYRLTPTELRVLLAIVEIGGGPEVAEALGIAEGTVKFHIRSLFEKTGARRQADLVKLVAGLALPNRR